MRKHVAISLEQASERLAIQQLVEILRQLCRSPRCAKPDGSVHRRHPLLVYINAKDRTPLQELHSCELGARSGLRPT
jgi:hypothetical protein